MKKSTRKILKCAKEILKDDETWNNICNNFEFKIKFLGVILKKFDN